MSKVVGVAGIAGAGKDSFASVLIEEGGYVGLNFAYPIKRMCSEIYGLSNWHLNTPEGKTQRFKDPLLFYKPQLDHVVSIIRETHDISNFTFELSKIRDAYSNPKTAKKLHTPREVMQFIGTDICRLAHQDYFVQVWLKYVEANPTTNFVTTDVRFKNERDAIRVVQDNKLVLITRDRLFSDDVYTHESETSLGDKSEYDIVIINDGTLEDLQNKAKQYI